MSIKAVIFDCFGVLTSINANDTNEALFAYIRDDLKPHYKIGMISNAGADWLHELFEPWQVELFDDTILSFEVGIVKPDPAIYEMAATRLGVTPEECIFVDDIEQFCTVAADLGMKAIWHQANADTIAKIKDLTSA